MTSRRDFLKGFAALASGLALAPASALASVQRLGTPADWIESDADRFERLARLGPVRDQRFVVDRPLRIPNGADIERCVITSSIKPHETIFCDPGRSLRIVNCSFKHTGPARPWDLPIMLPAPPVLTIT